MVGVGKDIIYLVLERRYCGVGNVDWVVLVFGVFYFVFGFL